MLDTQKRLPILVLFLIIFWWAILTGTTWKIQNSCDPMLNFGFQLPAHCTESSPLLSSSSSSRWGKFTERFSLRQSKPSEDEMPSEQHHDSGKMAKANLPKPSTNQSSLNVDLVGGLLGTGAGIVATVVGAPVVAAAAVGVVVWLIVRTIAGSQ